MWLLRGLRVAAILTPLLPARAGYALCQAVGILYYILNLHARRNIIENMRHVEPRASWLRREWLAARACITVVKNHYDLLRLRSVDRDNIMELIDVEGLEHVEAALERGKGLIVVSAHVGNFSVVARLPATLGYRSAIIAEEVKPAALYHYMVRLRSAMGIEVIPPGHGAVRRILRLLRDNGILLVAGDRNVVGRGMATPFFNATTLLPFGPALLAMRTGAALLPACTVRINNRKSSVVLLPPLEIASTGNWHADMRENVGSVARALEHMISIDPGQWAVLQRVWPPRSTFGRSEGLGGVDQFIEQSSPDRKHSHSDDDDIIPER